MSECVSFLQDAGVGQVDSTGRLSDAWPQEKKGAKGTLTAATTWSGRSAGPTLVSWN